MLLRSLSHRRSTRPDKRRGVATVELAICLPILMLLVVFAIEGSNFIFLKQAATVAAYEAAHVATQQGGTEVEAQRRAEEILAARAIDTAEVQFTPAAPDAAVRGTLVTVSVSAPASANSIGLDWFFEDQTVTASVSMVKD
jgi:Flp pilus assembly protein TadG